MNNQTSQAYGFTLIELLVVLVTLGLSISIVAPDMFKILERVQKRNELKSFAGITALIKEKSYFSGNDYVVSFYEDNFSVYKHSSQLDYQGEQFNVSQICAEINVADMRASESTDIELKSVCNGLKTIKSQFFSFEELSFVVSNGAIASKQTVTLFNASGVEELQLEFQ